MKKLIGTLVQFRSALFILSFVTLLSARSALAVSNDTSSTTAICTELQQQKKTLTQGKTSEFSLLIKLLFERSSLIAPQEVVSGEHSLAPQESPLPTEMTEIQNMTVFTLGHPEKLTDADKAQLKRIQGASKNEALRLRKLIKTDSVTECISEAQNLKWTPQELTDLQNLQDSAIEAYRHQESEASEKVAAKVKKEHPEWTTVSVDSWGEMTQTLRRTTPSGVLMIVHSSPTGRLFDSLRDELPTSFFKALPSSIKLVGVFSCDSGQVEKAYSLNDPSLGRQIITVKLGSPFDKSESTPVQLFPTWVSKISKEKLDQLKTAPAPQDPLCSVKINSLRLLKGRVSLAITNLPESANYPVGVWTAENQSQPQLFPCSWIGPPNGDHSKLYVFVQPSSMDTPVELADTNFSIEIVTDMTRDALPTITSPNSPQNSGDKQIFKTEDGHFRSAIFHF